MSIFKDKTTTAEAFSGIINAPKWPPDGTDTILEGSQGSGPVRDFAASSTDDRISDFYYGPRNRMNVKHAPRSRRGHDY